MEIKYIRKYSETIKNKIAEDLFIIRTKNCLKNLNKPKEVLKTIFEI